MQGWDQLLYENGSFAWKKKRNSIFYHEATAFIL